MCGQSGESRPSCSAHKATFRVTSQNKTIRLIIYLNGGGFKPMPSHKLLMLILPGMWTLNQPAPNSESSHNVEREVKYSLCLNDNVIGRQVGVVLWTTNQSSWSSSIHLQSLLSFYDWRSYMLFSVARSSLTHITTQRRGTIKTRHGQTTAHRPSDQSCLMWLAKCK